MITLEDDRAKVWGVANLGLFLASDAARTIPGQSINVHAGLIMT
jgi:hypothetical protein